MNVENSEIKYTPIIYEPIDTSLVDSLDLTQTKDSYQHFARLLKNKDDAPQLQVELSLLFQQLFSKDTSDNVDRQAQIQKTTGLLLALSTKDFKQVDERKLAIQLNGVASYCLGNFPAVDTGDGKSSVLNPVYLMLRALFADRNQSPIVEFGTATAKLVAESAQYYTKLQRQLTELLQSAAPQYLPDLQQRTSSTAQWPTLFPLQAPVIETPLDALLQSQASDPHKIADAMGIRAIFSNLDRVIHGSQEIDNFPQTYPECVRVLDEVHAVAGLYTKEAVHPQAQSETKENLNLANHYVIDSLGDYLFGRLLFQELGVSNERNANYEISSGAVELSSLGQQKTGLLFKKITTILQSETLTELTQPSSEPRADQPLSADLTLLNKLRHIFLSEIAPKFSLQIVHNKLENSQAFSYLLSQMNSKLKNLDTDADFEPEVSTGILSNLKSQDGKISPQESYFSQLAENVARAGSLRQGRDYIRPDLLRDRYRGIALPGRQYQSFNQFFVDLTNGKWRLPYERSVSARHSFAAWLNQQRGGVLATSGSLIFRHPATGKTSLTEIGELLEKSTQGEVVDLQDKTRRFILPELQIPISDQEQSDQVIAAAQKETRPEMIICWDDNQAKALYQQAIESGIDVALVLSDVTQDQVDRQIQGFVNKCFNQDHKPLIISSGMLGLGIDLKSSQGDFPDLKVTLVNPSTLSQVWQGFSRRRLASTENDFAWSFSLPHIKEIFSYFENDTQRPFLLFGKKPASYQQAIKLISRLESHQTFTPSDKEHLKDYVLQALEEIEKQERANHSQQTEVELFFNSQIMPLVKSQKAEVFRRATSEENSALSRLVEAEMAKLSKQFAGLSDQLQGQLRQELLTFLEFNFAQAEESLYEHFVIEYHQLLFQRPQYADIPEYWQNELLSRLTAQVGPQGAFFRHWVEQLHQSDYLELNLLPGLFKQMADNALIIEQIQNQLSHKDKSIDHLVSFDKYLAPPFEPLNDPDDPIYKRHKVPPTRRRTVSSVAFGLDRQTVILNEDRKDRLEGRLLANGQILFKIETSFLVAGYVTPVGAWQALMGGAKELPLFIPDINQYHERQKKLYLKDQGTKEPDSDANQESDAIYSPHSAVFLSYTFNK